MYERIKAKVADDVPEKTRAGILELFDDYRRLELELHKIRHISLAEVQVLMEREMADAHREKTRELQALRDAFVMTNNWHFMKNECYMIGIW